MILFLCPFKASSATSAPASLMARSWSGAAWPTQYASAQRQSESTASKMARYSTQRRGPVICKYVFGWEDVKGALKAHIHISLYESNAHQEQDAALLFLSMVP